MCILFNHWFKARRPLGLPCRRTRSGIRHLFPLSVDNFHVHILRIEVPCFGQFFSILISSYHSSINHCNCQTVKCWVDNNHPNTLIVFTVATNGKKIRINDIPDILHILWDGLYYLCIMTLINDNKRVDSIMLLYYLLISVLFLLSQQSRLLSFSIRSSTQLSLRRTDDWVGINFMISMKTMLVSINNKQIVVVILLISSIHCLNSVTISIRDLLHWKRMRYVSFILSSSALLHLFLIEDSQRFLYLQFLYHFINILIDRIADYHWNMLWLFQCSSIKASIIILRSSPFLWTTTLSCLIILSYSFNLLIISSQNSSGSMWIPRE